MGLPKIVQFKVRHLFCQPLGQNQSVAGLALTLKAKEGAVVKVAGPGDPPAHGLVRGDALLQGG